MKIVIFTHPNFFDSQSMPRYATLLRDSMIERGAEVEFWTAEGRFVKLPSPRSLKKWLGYVDQFLIFPVEVKRRLKQQDKNTLFVFSDHALGPWIPLVVKRKHIVHCHDLLAQRSALGEISENPTGWTGKIYQRYIRNGYRKAKNFISVSARTKEELHAFLIDEPQVSEVVYNAINPIFKPLDRNAARIKLGNFISLNLEQGYLLHVGGNQWYKNREGVILLYDAWRKITNHSLPLLMIGQKPSSSIIEVYNRSSFKNDIYFLQSITDEYVHVAYAGATLFLFPSLAEGFGWPIAEAMASDCLVATTGEAPMTEVAGGAALLLSRMPMNDKESWARLEVTKLEKLVSATEEVQNDLRAKGLENIKRFTSSNLLDKIYSIYQSI